MDQDNPGKTGKKLSLNFADKDEKENAKFNDARLVDILRNYPLLYNKSLESYGDPDYTQWMWGEIANEMNEPHRKTTLNLPFNWTTCKDQWDVIKSSLRYLSNPAAKSFRYPKQFKECLEFFQNYIRDRSEPKHTDRSQEVFLNFANSLETLPFEKQLLMEKEILDVILSSELEFCAPIIDPVAVEAQAREDFGTVIGLLMPEVNVRTVHNELSTEPESELGLLEEIMQKPDVNELETKVFIAQPLEVTEHKQEQEDGVDVNQTVEGYNLMPMHNGTSELQDNVHYAIQEDAGVDDLIEEDGMDDENIPGSSDENSEEVEMQECVFEEVEGESYMQEEDLIEEVISENGGPKELPALNISDGYEIPGSRLDFDGVLNEMLG